MTTSDPSREAFEKWAISNFLSVNRSLDGTDGYFEGDSHIARQAWQAAMEHKDAELQQANEARRQAQTQLADMQEKRNRIGLDIDRALSGQVNEESPIAGRLKLIAAAAAPKQEGST